MRRRSLFSAVLVTAAIASLGSAHAGGVVVVTDSGNIGEFHATNQGFVDGSNTAMIVFDIPNASSQLSTVNGAFITPEVTSVNGPITLLVTPTGAETYSLALSPATYQQSIGSSPGAQAILNFNLQTGVTPTVLPDFFNATGIVTGVAANANPNFDFAAFAQKGTLNFTLTATSFGGVGDVPTFQKFFTTPGATAVGNGSFSEAVPEHTSIALLGIGITGVFFLRRYFWKPAHRV